MGWPFGGKDKSADELKPSETTPPVDGKTSATEADVAPSLKVASEEIAVDIVEESEVPIPAVFEFGGSAAISGIQMKGICVGDDPDQIRACLWRVDPVDKSTSADEAKYQILF